MHKISVKYPEIPDRLNLDTAGALVRQRSKNRKPVLLQISPVERILEFGSGPSSIRLAMAFPEAQVCLWRATGGILEKPRI